MKLKGIKLIVYFLLGLIFLLFIGLFYKAEEEKSDKEVNAGHPAQCTEGDVDKQKINNYLSNAFKGKANEFIEAGRKNSVDPVLLTAIAVHETGNGSSNLVVNFNNPGGLYNSNISGFYHYGSLEEGLDAMAANLYKLYISKGLLTIDKIGKKYAPIGVANDPNNLNKSWIPTVKSMTSVLGGLSMNCEAKGEGEFASPTGSMKTTSPYGYRIDPITGNKGEFHKGVDFACSSGDPIVAAQSGKVVVAIKDGWGGGYGHHVILDHGDKYTLYGHMTAVKVDINDTVKKGEQIGTCGATGSATGPHSHFEVQTGQLYGERHDPLPYFDEKNKKKEGKKE